MTPDEARTLLAFHSGAHPDVDDPRWEHGFLGMLRPYRGLCETAFHEVMECVIALAPELAADTVDRATVSALWGICHLGRAWGLEPEGMLRRNGLITAEDVERLAAWIEAISYATMSFLGGCDSDVALAPYRELAARRG